MAARTSARTSVPRNARDVVLQGFDLHAGSFTATDNFTGPNTIVQRGELQPDGAQVRIPYTARITFGRPRPIVGSAR
jgi:hypothetical protein